MNKLDLLIEASAVSGQLAAGVDPQRVAGQSTLGARGVAVLAGRDGREMRKAKEPKWTPEEDRFIEACMGSLTDDEIGAALGRSGNAVHIRRERELGLPVRSKRPDVMSTEQVAQGLCKDGKSIHLLFDRGILPGWKMPGVMNFRLVNKTRLLMWLTNPMNWCYFDPKRIGNKSNRRISQVYDHAFWAHARRLVRKRRSIWKDEWLRIGEAGRITGIDTRLLCKSVYQGRLPAMDWGNYYILKSCLTAPGLCLRKHKGRGGDKGAFRFASPRAQSFLVLAEAVGLMHEEIGEMMGWKEKRVAYLLKRLHREGLVPKIIREHGLKAGYDRETGKPFASWRVYDHRFPYLVKKMAALGGRPRSRQEATYFNRAERKAKRWRLHIWKKFGVAA
jgi:hypothetical protein